MVERFPGFGGCSPCLPSGSGVAGLGAADGRHDRCARRPEGDRQIHYRHVLATRLGLHLDVLRIHAGKPPATALTLLPRLLVPAARLLFSKERTGEYEKPERRREKQYSLLYVLRMTLLAYDRRKLLRRALRAATAGSVVISDRYPRKAWVPSTAAALTKRRWQTAALR